MSDDGNHEEEKIIIDYDALDATTGFKKVELQIWNAFAEHLAKPEDDRPDVDAWADEFSETSKIDRKRVKYVTTLGIYSGSRDEFNQRSGSGKAIFANGDVYEGQYFDGKKHGQGHYIFNSLPRSEIDQLLEKAKAARPASESDEAFVSRVAEELKIGKVIVLSALEYGTRPCYHGDYHRGFRSGAGLMRNKDGSVYKGQWKDNKRHGEGIMYFVNGDIYSGNWVEGQKHGPGTYRFKDGGEYRGEWNKGVFVAGQWIMVDGNYYEGLFDKKNRPSDTNAVMHFPGSRIAMNGVFKKGIWAPQSELIVTDEKPEEESWA